jgi:Arc/MetJ-type ribon-helix-helix transcriptional regulator
MNVKLTRHSEDLLREHLLRGGYRTPEEVIERALENLAEKDGVSEPDQAGDETRTSILELQGLGKAIWRGVDAQEYVNRERASWNG